MQQKQPTLSPAVVSELRDGLVDPLWQMRILSRYRLQIVITVFLCLLLTLLILLVIKPTFRGTATVLIEPRSANVVKIQEVYDPHKEEYSAVNDYQNTQVELLRSRMLAEQVFDALKLDQTPEFSSAAVSKDSNGFLNEVRALLREQREGNGKTLGVNLLMDRLKIEPVTDTNLVRVNADTRNPELSAKIANALVDAYIHYDAESRGDITGQATGWLNQRLKEIKVDLDNSEKALQSFYDTEKLVNVGGARGLVETEITDDAQRLRDARKTKTELENVYRAIISAGTSVERLQEIPVIVQQELVQATKKSYLQAQQDLSALQPRYGRNHPKMVTAQARLNEARDAYNRQVQLAADNIRSQYEIAQRTESSVASIVEGSRSRIQSLDRKQNQLETLQREVAANRKLYDTFMERAKETDLAGNMNIGKVRVIERAIVTHDPFKPRKSRWLLVALMLGLLLGVVTALLRGYLDDTVKTPLDIERIAALPALTMLPRTPSDEAADGMPMETADASGMFAEGIRTLRTALLLSDGMSKRKRILVTSTLPGEGKTTVALSLAHVLGHMERVLLIDADLRKPSVATRLKLQDKVGGVTDALLGKADLDSCIVRHESSGIDVLPCGTMLADPLELLQPERFAALLSRLQDRYDRIVIDSPPCQPVSDSLLLARTVDAAIFLVKADSTPSRMIARTIKQLRDADAPLIGAVLNQAQPSRQSGFAYGYYYYQGGYGSYKAG